MKGIWKKLTQQSIYILTFLLLGGIGVIIYGLYYARDTRLHEASAAVGTGLIVISASLMFLLVKNLFEIETEMKRIIAGDLTSVVRISSPYAEIKYIEETLTEMKRVLWEREQKIRTGSLTQETLSLILTSVESVVQNVHDEILATDDNSIIKFFNKAAGELFGVTPAESVGKRIGTIVTLLDMNDAPISLEHVIAEVRASGKEKHFDIKNYLFAVRRDGLKIPVGLTISLTGDTASSTTIVFVFRNISAELEIQKLRDEFVFIAAHELRAPVAVITGYLELISEEKTELPSQVLQDFENIKAANLRLSALVDDLLEVARAEANKLMVDVKPLNSGEVIQEVLKQMDPLFAKKKQKIIDLSFPPVSSPVILSDPQRLREVFLNLLNNAMKYTPENGTITVKQYVQDDIMVTVISDTGIGIPEKEQKNVFERFWRSEKSRSFEGTGLGLFIVKQLMERMNGKIWFESKDNAGTSFFFSLPLVKVNVPTAQPPTQK